MALHCRFCDAPAKAIRLLLGEGNELALTCFDHMGPFGFKLPNLGDAMVRMVEFLGEHPDSLIRDVIHNREIASDSNKGNHVLRRLEALNMVLLGYDEKHERVSLSMWGWAIFWAEHKPRQSN